MQIKFGSIIQEEILLWPVIYTTVLSYSVEQILSGEAN
jgi:hypothetical protein